MDKIFPKLRQSYEFWKTELGEGESYGPKYMTIDDLLRAHYLLADYFIREGEDIAAVGPRDKHLLLSAIGRQVTGYGSVLKWKDDLDICATLFYGIVKNHGFVDGNKRTAFLIAMYQLLKMGRTPSVPQKEFENLAVKTAANELYTYPTYKRFKKREDPDVSFISDFFRRKTRKIDKTLYSVTYRQLETILNKYGFYFENINNNYVDIVTYKESSFIFGIGRRAKKQKIIHIGFPGYTRQVNQKALHSVLKETGLTPENNIDSQVLFKGTDPLDVLIDTYSGPLKRLKDR